MKRLVSIGSVLVIALTGLSGCSSGASASDRATQTAADKAAISDLEVVFHRAASTKNIEEMMSLYADNAVFTVGSQTFAGKEQIRNFILSTASFKPESHLISETPAYKIRTSSNGDRGTLYFECHYVDVDSRVVKSLVSADVRLSRVKGQWTFTNVVVAPAVLS